MLPERGEKSSRSNLGNRMRSNHTPSARTALGAVLTALAWGVFAPAMLQASCGDYVTSTAEHSSSQHTTVQSGSHQTHNSPVAPSETPSCPCRLPVPGNRQPLPCQGPACSAPTAPVSTTAPAPVQHPDNWLVPARHFRLIPSIPVASLLDFGRIRITHMPSGVFRPPRFSLLHSGA